MMRTAHQGANVLAKRYVSCLSLNPHLRINHGFQDRREAVRIEALFLCVLVFCSLTSPGRITHRRGPMNQVEFEVIEIR